MEFIVWQVQIATNQPTHNVGLSIASSRSMFLLRAYGVLLNIGLVIQHHKWSLKYSDNITYDLNFILHHLWDPVHWW